MSSAQVHNILMPRPDKIIVPPRYTIEYLNLYDEDAFSALNFMNAPVEKYDKAFLNANRELIGLHTKNLKMGLDFIEPAVEVTDSPLESTPYLLLDGLENAVGAHQAGVRIITVYIPKTSLASYAAMELDDEDRKRWERITESCTKENTKTLNDHIAQFQKMLMN